MKEYIVRCEISKITTDNKVDTPTTSKTETVDTPTNTPTDLISRQAAIDAVEKAVFKDVAKSAIESLPPVTPTKQQEHGRLIDADKLLQETFIVDDEEWTTPEIRTILENAPPVEPKTDLVNRSDVLELAKSGVLISNDNYEKVCKAINGLPSCHTCRECELVEPKPVCEDAISKHDLWRIIEDNAYWITYNETSKEKGMTLTGINQSLNECPPVEPKRPKGKWVENDDFTCSECGYHMIVGGGAYNFCPSCGCQMERADMRGEK